MQSVPLTDPDSLKAAPNGDLLLTNGDGGVIVDVQDPGGPNQAIAATLYRRNGTASRPTNQIIAAKLFRARRHGRAPAPVAKAQSAPAWVASQYQSLCTGAPR
jgi:hypothetical protein